MFQGWFSGGGEAAPPPEDEDAANAPPANADPGMFSGAVSFMKGIFGYDQLKVEETTEENKTDIDEGKRKGLFAQMSSYIGKDITSMISLPVWILEPLSFLQIMSEPLQYDYLLQKAADAPDSLDRLVYIAAFNCALYSCAVRTRKPFNPLLGETFEIVPKNNKYKFIAEQVSHHPPIGVSETTAEDYTLQLETELKSKFYGNSSEIFIGGTNHLKLYKSGDHITWGHLVTCCHNIILGSLWLDHYGDLVISNHITGEKCVTKFQKAGWLGAGRYVMTGEVFDESGNLKIKLRGKWNESLIAQRVDENGVGGEEYVVWESENRNIDNKNGFSKFILEEVISITPEYEAILPATDSRLRGDRRALEEGDLDLAAKLKHELEEKQRAAKRGRDSKGERWRTKFFEKAEDPIFGYVWKSNGRYWDARKEREKAYHTKLPDVGKLDLNK